MVLLPPLTRKKKKKKERRSFSLLGSKFEVKWTVAVVISPRFALPPAAAPGAADADADAANEII